MGRAADEQRRAAAAGAGVPGGSDYTDSDGRLIHVGSGFGGYFPWVRADVRIDDGELKTEFKDVGLRYKGNLSFSSSSAAAPLFANFKLKLDVHGTKGTWDGEKTFNLHAGVVDTSKMRDAIAYAIFRAAGVPAPRTAYVELTFTVPGVYQNAPAGLFTLIEDVNKKFLERALPPGTGLLMKPEGMRGGVQSMGDDVGVVHADLPARSRRDTARAAARDGVRASGLSAGRRPVPRQDRRPISTSISFSGSSPSTRSS